MAFAACPCSAYVDAAVVSATEDAAGLDLDLYKIAAVAYDCVACDFAGVAFHYIAGDDCYEQSALAPAALM